MEARDLVYDKIKSSGTGRRKSVHFTGLIDSSRVYISYKKEYRNISKRVSVWYNPISKSAFHREPHEFSYKPFQSNSSKQYLEVLIYFLFPPFIIFTLFIKAYRNYQQQKVIWKEKN